ncbi:MAG: hypothetical protein M3Z08_06330 [Chloroflexota bacterium]|nr:hypothetical protein [Chloroflexota bacterium]
MVDQNTFSDEDYQLSEVKQLGRPLAVYRLKPGPIRFMRLVGLLILGIGLVTLIFTLSQLPHFRPDALLPAWLASIYAVFQGGVMYGLQVRQAQSTRVIVCTDGLLQVKKMLWRNRIEDVRWKDIFTLTGPSIFYRDERKRLGFSLLTLTSDYQRLDELLARIAEHSEEFAHEEWEDLQSRPVVGRSWPQPEPQPEAGGKYRCPCCNFITLSARGAYAVCPVCYWQDDGQDNLDAGVNRLIGPNHMSLELGRENYRKFGAIHKRALECVRPPLPEEM